MCSVAGINFTIRNTSYCMSQGVGEGWGKTQIMLCIVVNSDNLGFYVKNHTSHVYKQYFNENRLRVLVNFQKCAYILNYSKNNSTDVQIVHILLGSSGRTLN